MPSGTLTIDLGAIAANWRALAALAAPAACAAVVKADAYGLGAATVAPALRAAGARTFFVATPDEALALRDALGPAPAIVALDGADAVETRALAEARVMPALNTPGQVEAARAEAARRGAPVAAALHLDVGMNRLGLTRAEAGALLDDPSSLDGLDLRLVMGHLSSADDPGSPANAEERARFDALTAHPCLRAAPRSLAATGGALLGRAFAYDLVRPGIGLYGGLPFAAARPVVALALRVLQVREVAAGESVGYGRTWRAPGPRRIATVAAGYADGLGRALSNRGLAHAGGRALPFVGRVSMDLVTLDATDAPEVTPGAMVEVLGPSQGIDDLGRAAGTVGYEILTSLGRRYARRYVGWTDA